MTRRRPPLPPRPDGQPVRLSRRGFLAGAGGGTAGAIALTACSDEGVDDGTGGPSSTPTSAPVERARQYFTPAEASTVEAATARILPGTPEDPGAREAEVVVYIDALLATGGWGGEPVYRDGPFVTAEDVETSDESGEDQQESQSEGEGEEEQGGSPDLGTTSYGVTLRPSGDFDRYGEQSMMTPPEVYRLGLPAMDAHARARFGAAFAELAEDQQDAVLADMESGDATTFDQPSGEDLFILLRQHTVEGMFSDPMYGGNRGMVGWQLIGWPAAQRAYSPEEMLREDPPRPPQSLQGLPHFESGERRGRSEPVLPQAGSDDLPRTDTGSGSAGVGTRGPGSGRDDGPGVRGAHGGHDGHRSAPGRTGR